MNRQRWDETTVGTVFRWVGGSTLFLKVDGETAVLDGPNPKGIKCHPSPWEEVVKITWSSLKG